MVNPATSTQAAYHSENVAPPPPPAAYNYIGGPLHLVNDMPANMDFQMETYAADPVTGQAITSQIIASRLVPGFHGSTDAWYYNYESYYSPSNAAVGFTDWYDGSYGLSASQANASWGFNATGYTYWEAMRVTVPKYSTFDGSTTTYEMSLGVSLPNSLQAGQVVGSQEHYGVISHPDGNNIQLVYNALINGQGETIVTISAVIF